MSCFTITVLEPSGKIIQVESVAGTNISTTTLTNYSVPNIELSQCLTQLPSDFNDRIFAVVSGDIVASTGILISSSGGKIYLNSILNSGNGISLSHDSGIYTISSTGLQPSGDYSLVGHQHAISDISGLQIVLDSKQPSGIYASGIHYHTISDITNFNSGVSGLLPSISGDGYITSSFVNNSYVISATGLQPSGNYSIVGHSHIIDDIAGLQIALDAKQPSGIYASGIHYHASSDITDFNTTVSGLLPVVDIIGGTNIAVSNSGSIYTVSVSGQLGLTAEEVDDRISNLLVAGTGITLNYNDNSDILTISTSGLQPSGNYSIVGHSHVVSDISGLQNALDSKQPSGNYSIVGHSHTSSDITDFNNSVSGLLIPYAQLNSPNFSGVPTVPTAASGTNTDQIASTAFVRTEVSSLVDSAPAVLDTLNELAAALNDDPNFATTIASGLAQKSDIGHTHASSDITNFNSSVSGLLPVTNISAGSGIGISSLAGDYTISVTGTFGLTSEEVDDRVSNLLIGGSYINLDYNDNSNTLTINTSGLQPSGNYSEVGHTHIASSITDFNTAVSGLLPSISGIDGYLSKFTGTEDLNQSVIYQSGSNIGIGTTNPNGKLHVAGTGVFDNSIRLGGSATSGTIVGLSTTGTVPALIFDTVGNNHGFNQALYEFRENGSTLLSIDGNGNLNVSAGNIVATATNPSTDNGAFGGHGMRRRLPAAGMEFAWGESIVSTTEPGIDLFPIGGTHITNGILFRLSKNSTKSDVAILVNGSGDVGIGTTTPSTKLDVNGSFNAHTINVSGVALSEYIDDEVNNLLVAGTSIALDYNDEANTLTINVNGVSLDGHSHTASDITDFNTAVSGLLPSISGVDGYISKFSGVDDLNQSVIYQSDTNIGIGTTSPAKPLEISYNHPSDSARTGGLRLTNPTSSSASFLEFGVGGSAGYDRYGICSLNNVPVFRIRPAGNIEFASSFYSLANVNWINTNNANAYINLNNGGGTYRQSCVTLMEFQVSSVTKASMDTNGFESRGNLRLNNGTYTTTLQHSPTANRIISLPNAAGTLSLNGHTHTGNDITESVVAVGNSGASKTLSIASGTILTCTLTDNCTFTMPTIVAGKNFTVFLNTGAGNYTASFNGVLWNGGTPPTITITSNKVDILKFISDGTSWYGSYSQNYG